MKYLTGSFMVLFLVACNSTELASTAPPTAPTAVSAQAATENSAPAVLSFDAAVYSDPAGRFEISYPSSWMVDASQDGSRGSYVQLTSWQHAEGGIAEIPSDGLILQITIYQWSPVGDLPARLEMRRNNFLSSENVILEESEILFPGGEPGVRMLLEDTNGDESVVVLLLLGNEYLELSGYGDITLLEEIIGTLRFVN